MSTYRESGTAGKFSFIESLLLGPPYFPPHRIFAKLPRRDHTTNQTELKGDPR
jgi:hypothetical protein